MKTAVSILHEVLCLGSNFAFQMLGNLKNPPEPFADVVRTHFRLKARSISAQLDQWLVQDDGKSTTGDGAAAARSAPGGSSNGLQVDVDEMKRVLKELQREAGSLQSSS